ncbi:MAG: hypothetical protein HC835_21205 [Oscillatoriales cyanobacterium RM2_1_1]|nr:hypothetical protein [Oscillatoriales cyanobacterium SM2_3_0]NJO47911.1 hypothetical protein [Oscillatoriales cyanobacterium RM2_1_1]
MISEHWVDSSPVSERLISFVTLKEQLQEQQSKSHVNQEINQGIYWISPLIDSGILAATLVSVAGISFLMILCFKLVQRSQACHHRITSHKKDTVIQLKTLTSQAQATLDQLHQTLQKIENRKH